MTANLKPADRRDSTMKDGYRDPNPIKDDDLVNDRIKDW